MRMTFGVFVPMSLLVMACTDDVQFVIENVEYTSQSAGTCIGEASFSPRAAVRTVPLTCENGVTGTAVINIDQSIGTRSTDFTLSNGETDTFSF